MESAYLRILRANRTEVVPAMFNPTDLEITRNIKYASVPIPGLPMPLMQFVHGESQTLKLTLFLDSSDRGVRSATPPLAIGAATVPPDALSPTVERRLSALRALVTIDGELHAPPVVEFVWSGTRFTGVVTTFTEKFALFDADGKCTRARVTLSFKSYTSGEQLYRTVQPESPDRTKTRVARAGERLDMIAAQEYGDPSLWTVIARANGISRPRVLESGTLLVVPPLD